MIFYFYFSIGGVINKHLDDNHVTCYLWTAVVLLEDAMKMLNRHSYSNIPIYLILYKIKLQK